MTAVAGVRLCAPPLELAAGWLIVVASRISVPTMAAWPLPPSSLSSSSPSLNSISKSPAGATDEAEVVGVVCWAACADAPDAVESESDGSE